MIRLTITAHFKKEINKENIWRPHQNHRNLWILELIFTTHPGWSATMTVTRGFSCAPSWISTDSRNHLLYLKATRWSQWLEWRTEGFSPAHLSSPCKRSTCFMSVSVSQREQVSPWLAARFTEWHRRTSSPWRGFRTQARATAGGPPWHGLRSTTSDLLLLWRPEDDEHVYNQQKQSPFLVRLGLNWLYVRTFIHPTKH